MYCSSVTNYCLYKKRKIAPGRRVMSPDAAERERSRANALFAGGRFREAVEVFSDLLAMDPDNTILLCNRSAALLKLKQNGAAVEDASLAVSLHPDAIKPRYRLASALLASGDSDGALQALEPALQQQPANEQLLALRRKISPEVWYSGTGVKIVSRRAKPVTAAKETAACPASAAPAAQPPPSPRFHWFRPSSYLSWLRRFMVRWVPDWLSRLLRLSPPPLVGSAASGVSSSDVPHRLSAGPKLSVQSFPSVSASCSEPMTAGDAHSDGGAHVGGAHGGGGPSVLSALPDDLLDACLSPLEVLSLVEAKCVCQAWAQSCRRLLPSRDRLPAATYTFTATRVCTHANSIFDELDTTTQVVGLGTITLGRRSIYEAAAAAAAAKKSEEGGPAAASVVPPIRNRPSVSLPPIRNRPSVSLRPHDVLPPIGWCEAHGKMEVGQSDDPSTHHTPGRSVLASGAAGMIPLSGRWNAQLGRLELQQAAHRPLPQPWKSFSLQTAHVSARTQRWTLGSEPWLAESRAWLEEANVILLSDLPGSGDAAAPTTLTLEVLYRDDTERW